MQCPYQNKLQDFLSEKLSKEAQAEVENHLEQCQICQKELDRLIDNDLDISAETLEIDDAVLVNKIKAHRKGIRRITVYGIIGFILGLFSHFYTADKFIITKAIMALPYKLAEFALGIFFSNQQLSPLSLRNYPRRITGMGFFPYNPIIELIVELLTPAIISTFIAVILGHLFSDKRVFRRKHIIRFLVVGFLVISIWFGIIHTLYSLTINQIDRLEGLEAVTIYEKDKRGSNLLLRIDQYNNEKQAYAQAMADISKARPIDKAPYFNSETGYELLLEFKGGGQIFGHLDKNTGVFIIQNRNQYQLSKSTIELLEKLARSER